MSNVQPLQLNGPAHRIAKRLAREMILIAVNELHSKENLKLFQGIGLALGFCFEEMVGTSASGKQPKEILKWALELPEAKIITLRS